jgi:O-glycosyl hydrolase
VTDATVSVFSALSDSQKSALLDDLFTIKGDDGVAFSLLRHTIGPSDLSEELYSYDDSIDSSLANFDLAHFGTSMASLISQFRSVNPAIKLLGSIWSPPGWMKANGVMTGQAANNNLNPTYVDAFTRYFIKYIEAFASGGASVDAITIQNEPLNNNSGYPTMYIAADQAVSLIQNDIGPALKSAGLSTEIWAYDHNTGKCSFSRRVGYS